MKKKKLSNFNSAILCDYFKFYSSLIFLNCRDIQKPLESTPKKQKY